MASVWLVAFVVIDERWRRRQYGLARIGGDREQQLCRPCHGMPNLGLRRCVHRGEIAAQRHI